MVLAPLLVLSLRNLPCRPWRCPAWSGRTFFLLLIPRLIVSKLIECNLLFLWKAWAIWLFMYSLYTRTLTLQSCRGTSCAVWECVQHSYVFFFGGGGVRIMFVIIRNHALSKHRTFFIFLLIQHGPCNLKFVRHSVCFSSKQYCWCRFFKTF
jgi:hypothetical protein